MASSPSPYAQAMLDYWHGCADAAYTIHRDDGFSRRTLVAESFAGQPFSPLEQLALDRCTGRVLDVGAGVGRHTLALQERGYQVMAIDVVPKLVGIMAERGVNEAFTESFDSVRGGPFDTILMLMNGFGMVGTPAGAPAFFARTRQLLSPGGHVLCDSLDVRGPTDPVHLAYQRSNLERGETAGQMRFWIEYQGRRGEMFQWLHLDFGALRALSLAHGWSAEMLAEEPSGHYLARLTLSA